MSTDWLSPISTVWDAINALKESSSSSYLSDGKVNPKLALISKNRYCLFDRKINILEFVDLKIAYKLGEIFLNVLFFLCLNCIQKLRIVFLCEPCIVLKWKINYSVCVEENLILLFLPIFFILFISSLTLLDIYPFNLKFNPKVLDFVRRPWRKVSWTSVLVFWFWPFDLDKNAKIL